MKKQIKNYEDYKKYINKDVAKILDEELSLSNLDQKDLAIKRAFSNIEVKEDGISVGYASTRQVDFSGDVVVPEGIDIRAFKINPVICYGHKILEPPIGKAESVRKDKDGLKIKIKFAKEEYDFANTIYKLVKGGYIRMHSIGYMPISGFVKGTKEFDQLNKELKKKWPEYKGDARRILTKIAVFEVSIVNLPDNNGAKVLDVKSLDLNENEIKNLKNHGFEVEGDEDALASHSTSEVEEVEEAEQTEEQKEEEPEEPEVKKYKGEYKEVKRYKYEDEIKVIDTNLYKKYKLRGKLYRI